MNRTRAFTWLALLIPLGVYLFSAAPGIYWEDSAAFQTAAYELGIVHNPSFPTYIMVAAVFSHLPFANPAWLANLLSALLTALTALILFRTVISLVEKDDGDNAAMIESIALIGAVGFAFVYGVWVQAVRAEVYALNTLFVSLLLWLFVKYSLGDFSAVRLAALTGLICGLAGANHYLIFGAVAIPLLGIVIWRYWREFGGRELATFLTFAALGLSVYLLLPIRAGSTIAFNWGDFSSVEATLRSILRVDEPLPIDALTTTTPFLQRLGSVLSELFRGIPLILWIFSGFGVVAAYLRDRFIAALICTPAVMGVLVTAYAADFSVYNLDLYGYLAPTYFSVFVLAICGAIGASTWLVEHSAARSRGFRITVPIVIAIALLVKSGFLLATNFDRAGKRDNCVPDEYAQSLLTSLPPNALFLAGEDNSYSPALYKQVVDKLRPDVIVLTAGALLRSDYRAKTQRRFPDLWYPDIWNEKDFGAGFTDNLGQWISRNSESRPVAMTLSQWTSPLMMKLRPNGYSYLYSDSISFAKENAAQSVKFYREQEALWKSSHDLTTREHFGRLLYNLAVFYEKWQQPTLAGKYARDAAECDSSNVDLLLNCLKLAVVNRQGAERDRLTARLEMLAPDDPTFAEIREAATAFDEDVNQ